MTIEAPPGDAVPTARVARLRVSNYRSLSDDVTVEFGDFTAFVGPNGSGKSNVLDVFRFLREALTFGLEPAISKRLGINRLRRVAPTKPRAIKIRIDLQAPDWDASYELQINAAKGASYRVENESLHAFLADGSQLSLVVDRGTVKAAPAGLAPLGSPTELVLPTLAGDPQIRPIVEALRSVRVHGIFPRELAQPQPVGVAPPLDDSGSNWCAVLRTLNDAALSDLQLGLERVTGDITGIRVDSAGGYYTAEFEHRIRNTTRWFSAGQESDGTLRLAGILTALLQSPAPPLLGIEEPELTINPGLLPLLYDYLRATSHKCQVAITTHSPDLLDLLDMDDVRVVERRDGATHVGLVAEHQRTIVKDSLLSAGSILRSGGFHTPGGEQNLLDLFDEDGPQ
ncbi:AAA family ATPase [Kineosporia sp. J2-2]|uniref:AAA family ATPase n=1 Tax=Kineosporia corallincola TaxID=2835133 RepID=A0ABS5TF49_9ACTN|nr:AAA family ATPase [Kineosporia corallincola]MBT0769715.1 AAA family ATPase [Kineosporia corallincola]